MNNKTLTFLVILAIIAGGLFYLKSRPSDNISINSDQSMEEVMTEAEKFAQAIESGKPYYCEISSEDTKINYYLKGGKMYMTSSAPEYMAFMINDGEYIYSWSDQSAQGSKMMIPADLPTETTTAEEKAQPTDKPSLTGEADYNAYQDQGYTINCQAQDVADSTFTPPSSITFIDPTAMMQDAMPDGETLDMAKLQEMAKDYEGMMPADN